MDMWDVCLLQGELFVVLVEGSPIYIETAISCFISLISTPLSLWDTIWVFPKIGVKPQNGWFIMENPIKMDDLGGGSPYFWKHPYLSCYFCSPKRNVPVGATNPNLNVCTAYREASWGTANGCMQWLGQSWPFGRLVSLTKSWLDVYHFLRIYNRNNILVWASQAALENGLSQLIDRENLGNLKKPWKRNPKSNGTSQNPWNKMKQHENTYGFQCKRSWIWFGYLWLSPVWRHPYSVCTWLLTNDDEKVGTVVSFQLCHNWAIFPHPQPRDDHGIMPMKPSLPVSQTYVCH